MNRCANGGNKMKIAWVTDSSALIPLNANTEHIYVLPLQINHENTSYKDGIDLTPSKFYQLLNNSDTSPKTSQPTVFDIEHLFQKLEASYDVIIAVLISNKISGTFATVASVASNSKIPVHLVDSKIISWPLYDLIEQGRLLASKGVKPEEIADTLNNGDHIYNNRIFVADLQQLLKGGRISKVGFLIGNILKIHPILQFKDGSIEVVHKIRTRKKSFVQMIDDFVPSKFEAWVLHCGDEETALMIQQMIKTRYPNQLVKIGELSPIIAIHGGQGSFAIVSKT